MQDETRSGDHGSIRAAREALQRGFTAIPVLNGHKRPFGGSWQHARWSSDQPEAMVQYFQRAVSQRAESVGLLLGTPSGGLIDIDLDHPRAVRLADVLPRTAMRTGRAGNRDSHRWYRIEGDLPDTHPFKIPHPDDPAKRTTAVEIRSTGAQTLIPPSRHPTGEHYIWEGEPWGGEEGPATVSGRELGVATSLLAMLTVLFEGWPVRGSGERHEAYLALAGGLLRFGDQVHPWWRDNLPEVIRVLAEATHDNDGWRTRVGEVMQTTESRLAAKQPAVGWTRLAELIGEPYVDLARMHSREAEKYGWSAARTPSTIELRRKLDAQEELELPGLEPRDRNPLEERVNSWQMLDLEPYIRGQVRLPEPQVLLRSDGKGLFYEGRVNLLFSLSESGKSWLALHACLEQMGNGKRVLYIDLEDMPELALDRLYKLGAGGDDIMAQFGYIAPEDRISELLVHGDTESETSRLVLESELERWAPTLVVVDGMTHLYGMHDLSTNDSSATDKISGLLRKLTRHGRTTVIVIDHTTKDAKAGSTPTGSHHKIAMVQGTALQVFAVNKPAPGQVGEIDLLVLKDRLGAVRRISYRKNATVTVAAKMILDSTEEDRVSITIDPPEELTADSIPVGDDPESLEQAVRKAVKRDRETRARWNTEDCATAVLGLYGGELDKRLSRAEIEAGLVPPPGRQILNDALDLLLAQRHLITVNPEGVPMKGPRGRRYQLVEPRYFIELPSDLTD